MESIRTATVNYLKNSNKNFRNVSNEELAAYKELLNDQSIVILKADRVNSFVIKDKFMYFEKGEFLNQDLFEKVADNDCEKMFRGLEYFLRHLLKDKEIPAAQFDDMKPKGHRTPFAFFLPKIHKPKHFYKLKVRPIVSSVESFNYPLAKFLHRVLLGSLHCDGDKFLHSFRFSESITDQRNSRDLKMLSFDIENLYPSIPLEFNLDLASKILKEREFPNMKIENLKKVLRYCTSEICFHFNSKFYKQRVGFPWAALWRLFYLKDFCNSLRRIGFFLASKSLGLRNIIVILMTFIYWLNTIGKKVF